LPDFAWVFRSVAEWRGRGY